MLTEQIISELKTMPSWKKMFHNWPMDRIENENPANRPFLEQYTRLTMSAGISVLTQPTCIDILCDIIKTPIDSNHFFNRNWVQWTISATPYHYGSSFFNIFGGDDPNNWGYEHEFEVNYYADNLKNTLNYLKQKQAALGLSNKVGMIYLDTETSLLEYNGDSIHDLNVKGKYNAIRTATQAICQAILGYIPTIMWYSQHSIAYRNGGFYTSTIPYNVPGNGPNVTLFYPEDPYLQVDLYNRSVTLAKSRGFNFVIPVISFGGFCRDYHTWINAGDKIQQENIYPYLNSWLMGRYMMWAEYQGYADGNEFTKAPYGFFWPGCLPPKWKYWKEHFLAFAYGCSNIHKLPQE